MNIEYKGWTLPDKVTIIESGYDINVGEIPLAYIIDSEQTKSIEKAKQRLRNTIPVYYTENNRKQIALEKLSGLSGVPIDPVILETDNTGFTLQLDLNSGSIQQSSTEAYWSCILYKVGLGKFRIDISADNILNLLLHHTFTKGTCTTDVSFAFHLGELVVLSKSMSEYQEALGDKALANDIKYNGTKDWQLGHVYKSLTKSSIYFGRFYRPIDLDIVETYGRSVVQITKSEHPWQHIIAPVDEWKTRNKNIMQYFLQNEAKLHESLDLPYKLAIKEVHNTVNLFYPFTDKYNYITDLPCYKDCGEYVEIRDNYYGIIDVAFRNIKEHMLQIMKSTEKENITLHYLKILLLSSEPYTFETMKPLDKELLELFINKTETRKS